MDQKPMIIITDSDQNNNVVVLRVEGGGSYSVPNNPHTVADKIHEINEGLDK